MTMAELTVSVAAAIAEGQGATAWEVYQLARSFLHAHGIEAPAFTTRHQPANSHLLDRLAAQAQELNMGYETQPAQASERDKPAECADGCPPYQVCDYCQSTAGAPDVSKPVVAEAVAEPAFWMVPGLASMCNALGDAAIVHNVHLATKPHNGFTAPLYTHTQPVTPAGGEVDSFEPWRAEVVALLVSKYGFSSEAATVFASSEVSEYIDGDCDCAEMLPVDLTDILMDVASDAVETWKRESVGRPFGYKSPAGGEVGPFGWWMECNGTDDDFGQFVRDPEFLENMRSHGVVTAATALYTHPPVADAALRDLVGVLKDRFHGRMPEEVQKAYDAGVAALNQRGGDRG